MTFFPFLAFAVIVLHRLRVLKPLKNCYLYCGRVKHSRLKGGAMHSMDYPIFFSYLDIDEVMKVGWSLWPIFMMDAGWGSFCSLQNVEHLKGYDCDRDGNSIEVKPGSTTKSLPKRVRSFIRSKSKDQTLSSETDSITLLTHLSYFGYCFNPVSFYYVCDGTNSNKVKTIIAEVSNTPWIEQHSYLLHESVDDVTVIRDESLNTFDATWTKAFHVSPFMEMDYQYRFVFSEPRENIWVRARLIKLKTKEVWFTANFEMKRMDFSPENLLYVLLFYPLHTRMIQLWIHWEAVKIWLKGVPTFEHPNPDSDVDFGFGITGKRLSAVLGTLINPFYNLSMWIFPKSKKTA